MAVKTKPLWGSSGSQRGFTQVELLVALAVVGMLAALLLPAIQQGRATARRVVCQNHLRQLGLALGNVAQATGVFPTAQIPEPAYWRMLPHLDAGPLRDQLVSGVFPRPCNIPVFVCPADPILEQSRARGNTNYYFNDGTWFRTGDWNGFSKGTRVDIKPSDVTDGLSQTAAISERLGSPDPTPAADAMVADPVRFFWFTERRHSRHGEEPLAIEECRSHRTTPEPQFLVQQANGLRTSFGYDHMLPPNHPACYNGPEDLFINVDAILISATSLHSGGVNVLIGDGSVHFVSETIAADVWHALGSRNGHESTALSF